MNSTPSHRSRKRIQPAKWNWLQGIKPAKRNWLVVGCSLVMFNWAIMLLAQEKTAATSLSLTTGIYFDQDISDAPSNFKTGGDYRGLVSLEYNEQNKKLRIYPRKTGLGTLSILDPQTGKIIYEFRLDVKKTTLFKVANEIQTLLNEVDGIQIRILNNKVIVDGQILLPRDMARVHTVVKQYGNLATSFVTLSPVAQSKIAQFIERKINDPEIQVNAINGKYVIEGVADSADERARAEIIAKTYVPDVVVDEAVADKKVLERKTDIVINLLSIKPPPSEQPKKIIQLVVHYVEMQKDYNKGFRFQWTPDIGDNTELQFSSGGRQPGGTLTTITGTIFNLLPKLNWAKEHGRARVLQSSSLIVQDGNQGILNSVSRIPYVTINIQGQPSTNFEEVGLKTQITPTVMGARSDSIRLEMSFSIKNLISLTDSGPLTSSREIQTVIVVRSAQSAAVGGLITNDSATNYNKLPANVSRNPLISLYASKDFRRSQTQFVTFVTPSIKASAEQGADQIKRKFRLQD